MFELLLCSLLTIFHDYLYRRYRQGNRFGKEITLFSVCFELRFGIVACLMLTVALITMIFYYHPSTSSATPLPGWGRWPAIGRTTPPWAR